MKGYLRKRGDVWYLVVDLPTQRGERRKQKSFRRISALRSPPLTAL
jgi:hypothetical protein